MTITARPLFTSQYAVNADTTMYTSSDGRTILDKCTAYNSDAATRTLTINIVASGGSAGASNINIVKSIATGDTYTFPEIVGHVLESGGFVSMKADAASKVVVRMSGRVVT